MLDQKDLELLQNLMQEVVKESEQNILNSVDKKIAASEQNVISTVDKKIAASERNVISSVDKKIAASERNILSVMDEKLSRSENMILNELDRVQAHLEGDLEKVQKNLEELKQFYKIDKLETDNTSLLLKMYNDKIQNTLYHKNRPSKQSV